MRTMNFIDAILHPNFAYTRARSWRLSGHIETDNDYIINVYHRDNGPSGVHLVASIAGLTQAVKILDSHHIPFPLSPTEGLRKN